MIMELHCIRILWHVSSWNVFQEIVTAGVDFSFLMFCSHLLFYIVLDVFYEYFKEIFYNTLIQSLISVISYTFILTAMSLVLFPMGTLSRRRSYLIVSIVTGLLGNRPYHYMCPLQTLLPPCST